MIGFGFGGILMGRLSDRFGVMVPVLVGTIGLGAGFIAAGSAASLWQFSIAQGALIGFLGTSATFVPLVADTSQWFTRRRGIAVAICMSGNYAAGTVWPPILQHFIDSVGWRATYIGVGVFCLVAMLPLALVLRPRPPDAEAAGRAERTPRTDRRSLPPRRSGRSGSLRQGCRRCCASPVSPVASPCRCRKCTSSPTAAISDSARRAGRKCSR